MKQYQRDIIMFAVVTVMALAIMWAAIAGENKQEVVDCIHLQKLSQTMPKWDPESKTGFYVTEEESETCNAHNITINAHVL